MRGQQPTLALRTRPCLKVQFGSSSSFLCGAQIVFSKPEHFIHTNCYLLQATALASSSRLWKCLVFTCHHLEKKKNNLTCYCYVHATTFTRNLHLLCYDPSLQAVCKCAFHGNFPVSVGSSAKTVICAVILPHIVIFLCLINRFTLCSHENHNQ